MGGKTKAASKQIPVIPGHPKQGEFVTKQELRGKASQNPLEDLEQQHKEI